MILRGARTFLRGGSVATRPGFVGALALIAAAALASSADARRSGGTGLLSDSLEGWNHAAWRQADVSVLACSLDRGDTLLSLRPARRLIPGSNMKLFTTGAFLRRHGPSYRRETVLAARGKASIHDGGRRIRFKGDLVLRASGMPDVYQLLAAGSRGLLDSLATLLRAGGLEKFEGTLWIDGSLFAAESYGPGWAQDDLAFAYGAPVNAVLANGNAATVVATGSPGGVTLALEPPEVPLALRGSPSLADSGASPRLAVRRAPGSRVLEVSGVVPRGGTARRQIAVPDPDTTAALTFLGAMRRAGIEVDASARILPRDSGVPVRDDRERIAGLRVLPEASQSQVERHDTGWERARGDRTVPVISLLSPSAGEIVGVVNSWSLNTEAEALLRLLDPAPYGKTRERGLAEILRLAHEAGVDTLDLSLVDGSGLSPMNLLTARSVVTWLTSLDRDSLIGPVFREGLARPGTLGTLRHRFATLEESASLRVKTGTLTNVSALSGFVVTRDGERIVFSMISNGNRGTLAPVRDTEEGLVALLSRFHRAVPPATRPIGIPR